MTTSEINKTSRLFRTCIGLAAAVFALAGADCQMGAMDPDGGGDNNGGLNALIKTLISLGSSGKVDVGDDLIVYGVGADEAAVSSNQDAGVHYLTPSQTTNQAISATLIPGSGTLFGTRDFKVAGKKVALVRSTGAVSIFDTVTETLTDIPITDIAVTPLGEAHVPGQMRSGGSHIATINKIGTVTDGNAIKVIDTSAATPQIISFPNPTNNNGAVTNFNQLDVDDVSDRVAAVADDVIYVFDINNPNAAPIEIDLKIGTNRGNFDERAQIQFDNGMILYHQDPDLADRLPGNGTSHAALLDVDSDTITMFNSGPVNHSTALALAGGSFAYLQHGENGDKGDENNSFRCAYGQVQGAPASMLASQTDRYPFRASLVNTTSAGGATSFSQDDCLDEKHTGYGATLAVVPDGSRWFMAGWRPIDRNYDYLQMSTGNGFTDFADPEGDTLTGAVMATDVVCSGDTVAFRALRETPSAGCITDQTWVVGFIVLDRLEN